ncbi:hypothetical protein AAHA92_28570 [Salvia divinorum]|uniref:DC1 domain-containing protein n=1 Tax=Salvia divinorum TaxID=28513 RepID=A0ABD1FVH2_SALDI
MRQVGGGTLQLIPPIIIPAANNELVNLKYKFIHRQHQLTLVSSSDQNQKEEDEENYGVRSELMSSCHKDVAYYDCYRCCNSSCDFIVHVRCAVLPKSVSSHRWDKHHQLLLTYDATLNHLGDFYCDQCETQMNPKSWMYYCSSCDLSFHPQCFQTTSGEYRNIKFGQEYVINATIHSLFNFSPQNAAATFVVAIRLKMKDFIVLHATSSFVPTTIALEKLWKMGTSRPSIVKNLLSTLFHIVVNDDMAV